MHSDVTHAAFIARLSPLASRIAAIVAEIAGKERALKYIDACIAECESRGIELLAFGTVLE